MFDTCVILAGGEGTRLRPLTNSCPKPLVLVNGEPFILYLIEYLVSYGISNILLLTGYCGDQFQPILQLYKERKGVSVRALKTPTDYLTSERLRSSLHLLEGNLLICYGDVYAEPDLTRLYRTFTDLNLTSLSVSALSRHKREKAALSQDLQDYKDIGFICLTKQHLQDLLSSNKISKIEDVIYQHAEHVAINDEWSYVSLTDRESHLDMQRQFSEKATIILDRDGVINETAPKGEYITNLSQLRLIRSNLEALQSQAPLIERLIVVSNQPWIDGNQQYIDQHNEIMHAVIHELKKVVPVVKYLFCPHSFQRRCSCRKPKPSLLSGYLSTTSFLRRKCIVIGDSYADSQLAQLLGDVGFMDVDWPMKGLDRDELHSFIKPRICTDHRYYRLCGLPHGRFDYKRPS